MIMNRSPYPLETFVKLRGSPDYKFIHVEEYGYVVSYSPRLSSGDHHHLIWVRGEDEVEVHLPIAPQVRNSTVVVWRTKFVLVLFCLYLSIVEHS